LDRLFLSVLICFQARQKQLSELFDMYAMDNMSKTELLALGHQALQARNFEHAHRHFSQCLTGHNKDVDVLLNCAMASHGMAEWQQVIGYCRRLLKINRHQPQAYYFLADAQRRLDKTESAISSYKRVLSLQPELDEARLGLALCLRRHGELAAATAQLETLLRRQPDHVGALNNLGNIYVQAGRWREAEHCYRHAVAKQPALLDAWVNLGVVYEQLGELDQAFHAYERACALRAEPWPNFDRQIACDAVSALLRKARTNQMAMGLRRGQFDRAWQYYDFRLSATQHPFHRQRPAGQLWRGQALQGRRIHLLREQGLGDEICYASYLPDILRQAGDCLIECHPRLVNLFAASFPRARVIGVDPQEQGDTNDTVASAQYDFYSPIPSLGQFIRRSVDDFHPQAYLQPDASRLAHWRQLLRHNAGRLSVGISWRGGGASSHGQQRSIQLESLVTALQSPAVQLVNLQYGDSRRERAAIEKKLGVKIIHYQQAIDDYDDTAALVAALDLVISVDTSVAHLAGALGQQTWCLLPAFADWRWQLRRRDTLWYPRMTLYRQPRPADWSSLLQNVADDFVAFSRSHQNVT